MERTEGGEALGRWKKLLRIRYLANSELTLFEQTPYVSTGWTKESVHWFPSRLMNTYLKILLALQNIVYC